MWTMRHRILMNSAFLREEKKSPKSSKNIFKATFYLRHSDTANAHRKDKKHKEKPQRPIPDTLHWV